MTRHTPAFYCILLIIFTSCSGTRPYYNTSVYGWEEDLLPDTAKVAYSVLLVGDTRRLFTNEALIKLLEFHISSADKNSTLIFMGDNIEPKGLPDSDHRLWNTALKSILTQFRIIENYKGKVIFIPGNHDWANGQKEGLSYIKNQRKFIEDYLDKKDVFLPKKGSPGPVEINLTEDIVLIIIDSHWWLHDFSKSYDGIEDEADFFIQIKDIFDRNRDKKIIFTAHHPLYSIGKHGGHFPLIYNIFPLLEISKYLYVPLPGFIYTGYRKFLGANQDISHPQYKMIRNSLAEIFHDYPNLIYTAGHEHNLQYVKKDSLHQIISGSAGITSYTSRSRKTDFAMMREGFSKLYFYNNGDVWLEFWIADDQEQPQYHRNPGGKLVFRKKLFNKQVYIEKEHQKLMEETDYPDSTVVAHPNGEKYQAGKIKRILLGNNYRKEWIQPVEVPVFNFGKEKGGLKIVKRGGGFQTKSLRLEDKKERQWVLRSLDKDASAVIPEVVKIELAVDLVQDAISSSIPYSALSVPRLADAVEIYHTNPQLVYLTDDPRLGKYNNDLADGMYLFEERPSGNREDVTSFGNSKDIIGSPDMIDNIMEDPKHQVDQLFYLKSRLFDIFINDWDRHEDQWRWASFKKDKKIIYRPIPRDRDQTFFINEGIIPWISSRKFAVRRNQGFDYDIKDMGGLNFQARHLDRRFLNELSLDDWLSTAEKMQKQLTSRIIEEAIFDMPEEIARIDSAVIIDKLKARRDKLPEFAREYYLILSREVDIVGTDEPEYFSIERIDDEKTEVTVFALDNKGKKKDILYNRIFLGSETKEIRLYGLDGKDEFKIKGEASKGIKVRIIGGKGKDEITDESRIKGWTKRTLVYDTKDNNKLRLGNEGKNLTSNNPYYNEYDYYAFKYDLLMPLVNFGYNSDDGIFTGLGYSIKKHRFKKLPFADYHKLLANYAFATNAYNIKYEGVFTSAFFGLDLNLYLEYRAPTYTQNYFGPGNNSEITNTDKDYNRVRIGLINVYPELSKSFKTFNTLSIGLFYQSFDVERTPGRFISEEYINEINPYIFKRLNYFGLKASYILDTRNNKVIPSRGVLWNTELKSYYGISDSTHDYNQLKSELSFYMSFRKPYRTVFAFRIGGSINSGDYEFFQACSLGGKYNLRGYRATRFSGDACLYQNSELRFKLFDFSNYISKGQAGIIGFNDIGRVWLEGENSKKWHHGYGGGLWISPFNMAVITATYDFSIEDDMFSVKFNFLF